MNTIKTKTISWIDIKNPGKKDLKYLEKEFDFHPITLGELLLPTLRPKVEHYDHYLYMVVHFPIYEPKTQTTQSVEIDFLITQNTLITVRYEELPPIKELWGKCQIDKTILDSLKIRGVEFFGKKMRPYFMDIIGDYMRVWSLLENHIETIRALRETNDSLVSNRTNKIIRILTIFSVIVFPLTLLASIFGMNTRFLPLVGHEHDFWIIAGFMLLATLGMLIFFKRKKWF